MSIHAYTQVLLLLVCVCCVCKKKQNPSKGKDTQQEMCHVCVWWRGGRASTTPTAVGLLIIMCHTHPQTSHSMQIRGMTLCDRGFGPCL